MSAVPGPVDLSALDATAAPKKRNRYRGAWRSFSRSRYGMLGLSVLIVMIVLAILAPLLTNYGPFELGINRSRSRSARDIRSAPIIWAAMSGARFSMARASRWSWG